MVWWLVRGKRLPQPAYKKYEGDIYVILAVYNGEQFLQRVLDSIGESEGIQNSKLHIVVGSDASTDNTNSILRNAKEVNSAIIVHEFVQRRGKTQVINDLIKTVPNDALMVLTDVSVVFDKHCIATLVQRLLQNPDIGIVGGNIVKGEHSADGISYQEKVHYNREVRMKYAEGVLWGTSMGLFGACYALRKIDADSIPANFLSDDFYMTLQVLERKKKALIDLHAMIYMDLPNISLQEFKRKVRISVGNYQNLVRFWKIMVQFDALAFTFISHRVLRWLGPFILATIFITNWLLFPVHELYRFLFYAQLVMLSCPILNLTLASVNIHNKYIRFVSHFYSTNLALLIGFWKFITKNYSSTWQPTKR